MEAVVEKTDIEFLISQFEDLTDARIFISPVEWIQKVRYIDKSLTPFPGKFSYDKFPYFKEIV